MGSITRILRSFSTSTSVPKAAPEKPIFYGLYRERDLQKVVDKFKTLSQQHAFRKKNVVYDNVVHRLASAKKYDMVEEILEDQKQYPDISREGFSIRLMSLYGKSSMFDHAFKVFDEMPERKCPHTVTSFNALLDACISAKKFDKIDGLFRELPGKISVKPNIVSYNTVIKGFVETGSLDSAASMFDEIEKNGLEPDLITFNTLLFGFYYNRRFLDGEKYWAKLMNTAISPDIRSYNAKLFGMSLDKKTAGALELFNELCAKNLKPDGYTHNAIINCFCKDDNLQEAKNWYSKLLLTGPAPIKATFKILIPFTCRMSDLDWAVDLFKQTFEHKCFENPKVMQLVINELVMKARSEEAKQLLEMSDRFRLCKLTMPYC